MNNILVLLILCFVIFIISYLAINNLIISLAIFVIFIIYSILIANNILKKYKYKMNTFHNCYYFINNFLITLSIKKSLKSSFDSIYQSIDDETSSIIKSINDLSEQDKLKYLSNHFRFDIYSLFAELINVYVEEGGDILNMSQYLVNNLRNTEDYIKKCEQINKKKTVEFAILWAFSFAVLILLRFSLSSFYKSICNKSFFLIGVFLIFLFFLFSIHFLLKKISFVDLPGWSDYEK